MNRIIFDVPRWDVYLHRRERKLPLVKEDDSPDLRFEDEIFERLYSGGAMDNLRYAERDHTSAPWAEKGHAMCDDLGINEVMQYCQDHPFNSALATAWLVELIEDPLGGAKGDAEPEPSGGGDEEADLAADGFANVSGGSPEYLKNEPRLLRIALLAGRLRSSVITKQRSKTTNGAQEIVNITIGGELERMIPAELVRFTSKRLKLSMMRDLIEHKLMQYEMIAREPLQQGPIVVCLDKSGSMHDGGRDTWASSVALSMLDVAQRQKRAFALVSFNHEVISVSIVKHTEKLDVRELMIEPDGGTFIHTALGKALDVIQGNGTVANADIVLISDGEDDDLEKAKAAKRRAEAMGVTIFGVGIATADISMWCHKSHVITDLSSVDESTKNMLFTI